MMADTVLTELQSTFARSAERGRDPEIIDDANRMMTALKAAQRFVLSPRAISVCEDVADWKSIRKSRDYLHLPALTTWIEWVDPEIGRVGVMFEGKDGEIVVGTCAVFLPLTLRGRHTVVYNGGWFDFPGDEKVYRLEPWEQIAANGLELTGDADYHAALMSVAANWDRIARTAIGSLALINTPRISIHTPADLSKLNKARAKRGNPPILSYTDLDIRLDDIPVKHAPGSGLTGEIPYHHVRTFFRLRLGKLEVVRPHWRGNPEKGVRIQRHVVKLAGEEGGEWRGGVLPMPKIIKEGE